jgi:dolichol-phosphate mannosyltransferase
MSLASVELPVGIVSLSFGLVFGVSHWLESAAAGVATPPGTVMLAALPVVIGLQLLLAFLGHDIQSVPRRPFHVLKRERTPVGRRGSENVK